MHKAKNDANEFEMIKKIHDSHVTDIVSLKCGFNKRLITASQDGSVKIWTGEGEKQLGQYNFNSGITCFRNVYFENNSQITIICADQACDIHVLIWYDKNY